VSFFFRGAAGAAAAVAVAVGAVAVGAGAGACAYTQHKQKRGYNQVVYITTIKNRKLTQDLHITHILLSITNLILKMKGVK